LFLCLPCVLFAQDNGTIVENVPCAANTVGTFEQYVETSKKEYTEEVGFAKGEGFTMDNPSNLGKYLLTKDEFERRKRYKGFECRRIRYLSDGLKVVGYLWKPEKTNKKSAFPITKSCRPLKIWQKALSLN
jgi:hypothetical protein